MADNTPVVLRGTGASRGAGAGIARALGSHGCTVYVTGRTDATRTTRRRAPSMRRRRR